MEKREELRQRTSVWNRTAEDEPVFVLVARDVLAPGLVAEWCRVAELAEVAPEKIADARRVEAAMRAWQDVHGAKRPD
jgi:hypothetical protein